MVTTRRQTQASDDVVDFGDDIHRNNNNMKDMHAESRLKNDENEVEISVHNDGEEVEIIHNLLQMKGAGKKVEGNNTIEQPLNIFEDITMGGLTVKKMDTVHARAVISNNNTKEVKKQQFLTDGMIADDVASEVAAAVQDERMKTQKKTSKATAVARNAEIKCLKTEVSLLKEANKKATKENKSLLKTISTLETQAKVSSNLELKLEELQRRFQTTNNNLKTTTALLANANQAKKMLQDNYKNATKELKELKEVHTKALKSIDDMRAQLENKKVAVVQL